MSTQMTCGDGSKPTAWPSEGEGGGGREEGGGGGQEEGGGGGQEEV